MRYRATRLGAATAVGLAGLLAFTAGCSDDDGRDGDRDAGEVSPFTGLETDGGEAPVLAVKIDNAPAARPQTGLDEADIVYVEPVEGGMSRFLAVFSGELPDDPDEVGPVRSGREADLELLEQFGDPAFAYSGVNSRLLSRYQEAADDGEVVLASPAEAGEAYRRRDDRPAPYNLYADPAALLAAADGASTADDIGFRFGRPPATGGEPTREHQVSYASASLTFTWSEAEEHWQVALDGEPSDAEPATVVVQNVTVRDSELHDVAGAVSPYPETVGSGTATVLRDGRAYQAEWSRPTPADGTTFTTPDGEPLRFDRGPVWVVFAPA